MNNLINQKKVRVFLVLLLGLLLFPFMLFLFLAPQKREQVSYGFNFSNKYAQELDQDWKNTFTEIVTNFPTKKYRLAVYWDEVQPNSLTYDYSNIKYQLDILEKYPNSEVILVFGRKVIRYPECHEPQWWIEIREEEVKKEALLKYIEKTVLELKDYKSIKYWQVENESLFPFGICSPLTNVYELLQEEVELVKSLDPERKIIIQDSGEGGFWLPSAKLGDYLGISIYRKVWFDFLGVISTYSFPLKYPLGNSFYSIKAFVLSIPFEKIKATEVQAEPWGPVRNYILRADEVNSTMSPEDFERVFVTTQEAGFDEYYLWGVEWWYHMKIKENNPFYWEYALKKIR
jgi:hypothetical protein